MLTHRRPRLARETVLSLLVDEGLPAARVVLVIDRDGGLDDPALEARLTVLRLTENRGPAAGFRAGLEAAFADPAVGWAYLVEDDACLLGVTTPRLGRVLAAVGDSDDAPHVGAVVVEGRRYAGHGNRTVIAPPQPAGPVLQPVDVAAWGMTLLRREVVEAGVLPDDHWFFGYEDFDFFLRLRAAGFNAVLDRDAGATAEAAPGLRRPAPLEEPWRAYYLARNTFEMIRRHGRFGWYGWHLWQSAKRARHVGPAGRRATVRGLIDGARGRGGRNPAFVREVGEHASSSPAPSAAPVRR